MIGISASGAFHAVASGGRRGTVDLFSALGHADGWMSNLILDSGIVGFLNSTDESTGSQYGFIQLGTGSAPARVDQTELVNRTHGGGNASKTTGKAIGYDIPREFGWTRATHTFTTGTATGVFREIGAGPAATGPLFSRALITDADGRPASVAVLADEQLVVTYELRCWWQRPTAHDLSYAGDTYTVSYPAPTNLERGNAGAPQNAFLKGDGVTVRWKDQIASGTTRQVEFEFTEDQGGSAISGVSLDAGRNVFVPSARLCNISPSVPKPEGSRFSILVAVGFERGAP